MLFQILASDCGTLDGLVEAGARVTFYVRIAADARFNLVLRGR